MVYLTNLIYRLHTHQCDYCYQHLFNINFAHCRHQYIICTYSPKPMVNVRMCSFNRILNIRKTYRVVASSGSSWHLFNLGCNAILDLFFYLELRFSSFNSVLSGLYFPLSSPGLSQSYKCVEIHYSSMRLNIDLRLVC